MDSNTNNGNKNLPPNNRVPKNTRRNSNTAKSAQINPSLDVQRVRRNNTTGPTDRRPDNLYPIKTTPNENNTSSPPRRNVRSGQNNFDAAPNVVSQPTSAPRRNTTAASRQSHGIANEEDSNTRISSVIPKVDSRSPMPPSPNNKKGKKMRENTMMSGFLKGIIYIVVVLVVSSFSGYLIINIGNDVFAFVKPTDILQVDIPDNADISDIAKLLGENEVIRYPAIFKLYAKYKKDKGNFEAGIYEINPSMNYDELLHVFRPKNTRETIWISIPEGFTVDEIIELFVSHGIGTKEAFIDTINNYEFEFEFINELEKTISPVRSYRLEGYLFPDTYEFYTDSSEVEIIRRFLSNFDRKFNKIYYDRAKELGLTVDEVITLASMIEKETKFLSEFEIVSSVFHNRLNNQINFPYLESDATILYAIQIKTGERPNTLKETTFESPYNSYKNKGFPPGPIANPGYNAITCALYPAKTNFYYFVSKKDGTNIFSRTYNEHIAAIAAIKKEE